jgi:chaperonin GroES
MAGFRPTRDRVLVKRVEVEERTPGGILVPDTAKEKPAEGDVLAVGPGVRDGEGVIHPVDLRIGDRVVFGKWAGTEIIIGGEDRLVLQESDILGVVDISASEAKAA